MRPRVSPRIGGETRTTTNTRFSQHRRANLTSVRSERVFSAARNTVNEKRAALDPDQVDRLVFLANNIKKLLFLTDRL